jgi:hypothetical protein
MAAKTYLQAALEADRESKIGSPKKMSMTSPPVSPGGRNSPTGAAGGAVGGAGGGGALFKGKIGNYSGLAKTLMST